MRQNRREILIDHMVSLEKHGMGCSGCEGTCCTFQANSMLMTPLEAKELFDYLKNENFLTSEFKQNLQETIKKYRLEPKFFNERKSYLRKTYTCPFFGHKELGCPLPREIKPYGCLAFDSHHSELKASEHCYSETELLKRREELHPEENDLNEKLRLKYHIQWEKSPIPNAILELWIFEESTS
jgi:hypothetical protein